MEASGAPQDAGHSGPLSHSSSSSSLPPARPGRPQPPHPLLRSSQLPAPFLPPLPPPLSPIVLSSSPPPDLTSDPALAPPPGPCLLSSLDRLLGSVSVWQPRGLSPDTASRFLENQPAGTFLAHAAADRVTMISVRLPDEGGAPAVRGVAVQQHHTFVHLEGSSLLFDDVFKMISFYCTSRDILAMPLKLPLSVAVATREEDLEVLSALGADFWMSDLNQRPQNPDWTVQPNSYLYVNPVPVEGPSSERKSSVSKPQSFLSEAVTPSLQNGETSKKLTPQVKVPKRRLLSSPLSPPATSSGTPESDRKELPQGTVPPAPQLPQGPVPPAPQLPQGTVPPAPLQCTSGCQLPAKEAIKKPSRPVPPPRTKPSLANSAGGSNQAAGGLTAPQGAAGLAADLDSCSTSSTEEEGELNQEQDANPRWVLLCSSEVAVPWLACNMITMAVMHRRVPMATQKAGGHRALKQECPTRSPRQTWANRSCTKGAVRRTPTIMLDRARHRLSTVLTGLICHDGRLTKRIIELARDPVSYFGNLVKDHRAFTLETMSKHTTSTELLQEIRQMMTQLKSYLLQSTELQALLEPQHQYTQDKLESLVEAALCKSVLKPLKEPIYRSLERLHTESRRQLEQNQAVVLASTTTALGICTSIPEAAAMERISLKLSKLHQEYSPQRKIQLLLKACRLIYHSMSVSCPGRAHGADDFLPVMMYVLARSNMAALQLDVEYMMELMDPALTQGEGSYYLTTTYGALEHIKTFDQQRSATRQLSREVQDSIHRWERRRTLNQEPGGHDSVRDFLTVFCPEIGVNPKTLGVLPTTSIQELTEQCAARFE
uniref:Ras and Rab interactor 3 n=1 Tax=Poecilia formosa TaxID=48698 RepID=A0A096M7P9_POEFO